MLKKLDGILERYHFLSGQLASAEVIADEVIALALNHRNKQ